MLIDWFTVGAQALNFIVLVALLKRFLYQPVLAAIDARESLIAGQIAGAQATQLDAQAQRDLFRRKSERFDDERAGLLLQAAHAADAERTRLVAAAQRAADELAAGRHEALRMEALQLDRDLAVRVRREVFAVSRRALSELASTGLEERIAAVFIERLGALDEPARAGLARALRAAGPAAVVRSAFELPATQRTAIQAALTSDLNAAAAVRFETAENLISGIELVAGDQKLSWNLAHALDAIEHLVTDMLVPALPDSQAAACEPAAPTAARA